jgi:NADH-quinone oxidoreductase subunit E
MCCCKQLSEGAAAKFAELDAFIDTLGIDRADERRRGRLIQVLHKAQKIFGYLPREVQQHVAEKLYLQEAQVSGVVSFYNYFTTEPKGKYCIDICLGTACYVKGSEKVLSEIERVLGVKADTHPTEDGLFSISGLRCVGACGLAPVMMVNGKVYGKVTPAQAVEIVAVLRQRQHHRQAAGVGDALHVTGQHPQAVPGGVYQRDQADYRLHRHHLPARRVALTTGCAALRRAFVGGFASPVSIASRRGVVNQGMN